MQDCPDDNAVNQPVNAQPKSRQGDRADLVAGRGRKHQGAEDLAQVVHEGGQGREEEVLVGLQSGHDQPADREDQGGDQVHPHQLGDEALLLQVEAGSDAQLPPDERFGDQGGDQGEDSRHDEGQVGNPGEQVPGGSASPLGQVFG